MSKLTEPQRIMLRHIARVCENPEWDGYAPSGIGEWSTIRALERAGLVTRTGPGECGDGCERGENHPHIVALFVLSDMGRRVLEAQERAA